ncbi:hypothetical protein OG871_34265 [Kitasatospora sp. NBC_00374]|uniref:hypothetical protein n=1 Tax=Kitasatospora sp. NBC_00374 TaxID=2975964 RepID=UPI0030DE585C
MSHRTAPAAATAAVVLTLLPTALPFVPSPAGSPAAPSTGDGPAPRAAGAVDRAAPPGAPAPDRHRPAENYAVRYRLEPRRGCPVVELRTVADRASERVYVCVPRTVRSMET